MSHLQPRTRTFSAPAEFFDNEHKVNLPGGITIDATEVASASDGSKILEHGAVMAKVTSSGKYAPYDVTATGTGKEKAAGLLDLSGNPKVDLQYGDETAGLVIHAFVNESLLPDSITAAIKSDLPMIHFQP